MAERLTFDCPSCEREYELALDLEEVKRTKKRAKCSRCGEQFEIAARARKLSDKEQSASEMEVSADDIIEENFNDDCEIISEEPCDTGIRTHIRSSEMVNDVAANQDNEALEPNPMNWLEHGEIKLEEYTLSTPEDISPLQNLLSRWG